MILSERKNLKNCLYLGLTAAALAAGLYCSCSRCHRYAWKTQNETAAQQLVSVLKQAARLLPENSVYLTGLNIALAEHYISQKRPDCRLVPILRGREWVNKTLLGKKLFRIWDVTVDERPEMVLELLRSGKRVFTSSMDISFIQDPELRKFFASLRTGLLAETKEGVLFAELFLPQTAGK